MASITSYNVSMWQAAYIALPMQLMVQNMISQNALQDIFTNRSVFCKCNQPIRIGIT